MSLQAKEMVRNLRKCLHENQKHYCHSCCVTTFPTPLALIANTWHLTVSVSSVSLGQIFGFRSFLSWGLNWGNQPELHSTLLPNSFVCPLTGEATSCPLGIPSVKLTAEQRLPSKWTVRKRASREKPHCDLILEVTSYHFFHDPFLSLTPAYPNWEECILRGGQRHTSSKVNLQAATDTYKLKQLSSTNAV